MPEACKNHPETLTRRRCFQCKEYICSSCASLSFHHYFCSNRCKTIYLVQSTLNRIIKFARSLRKIRPAGILENLRTALRHVTFERAVIVLLLATNLIVLAVLSQQIRSLNEQLRLLESRFAGMMEQGSETSITDTAAVPVLDPDIPSITLNNTITISGRGQPDFILALYLNGRLYSAQPSGNESFIFDDVKLAAGKNHVLVKAISPDNMVYTIDEITITNRSPGIEALSRNITRGNRLLQVVSITFDGGSNSNNTEEILDILKEKGIRTTVFLTGKFIQLYPEVETYRTMSATSGISSLRAGPIGCGVTLT